MLGDLWISSFNASRHLGMSEENLSLLRERGFLKPGIHWKSSAINQIKPWNPVVVYDLELCKSVIDEISELDCYENYAA